MSARPVRLLAVALAAAVLAVLPGALLAVLPGTAHPAAAAGAAARTVQGGRLDWGVKSSFQAYVTGPVAQGRFRLTAGAATAAGSLFRFHSATGSYDPRSGAFEAAFSGGVQFLGHRKDDGTHALDLTVSRPRIVIGGGKGTLYADLTSRAKDTGTVTRAARVPLAALALGGVDMRGGTSPVALTGVPATLTAEGARAFAGYYPAGTPLDPVALSVDVTDGPTASPRPPAPTATPPAARPGVFTDAAVDWGVRRTFREYVTGAIEQGRWELTGGAEDGGAVFRFPRGTGTYDPAAGRLEAAFAGRIRFTGRHLGLAFDRVGVSVTGGKGVLRADVTTASGTRRAVPLVEFDAGALAVRDGLATLTEAPATLTAGGSQAFRSLYRPGTAMDPVSLAVAVTPGAALPAL
ncbi:HtaA domain-containing protein, partial [Streptomyces bambusae]|uniref:HtaA domain-containing protein n=1 Tax=Streptomyces bambusae TaxID=1550616 RepID=UPI001CFFC68A